MTIEIKDFPGLAVDFYRSNNSHIEFRDEFLGEGIPEEMVETAYAICEYFAEQVCMDWSMPPKDD